MNQICRALGAAHAKGIIHRDMKPENVYLVDARGQAGLRQDPRLRHRQDVSSLDEGGSRLTRTGMIFGTPEYMSPEQAKGDRARPPRRHLRRRLHPLRDADRRRAVPRRDLHGRAHQAHVRAAASRRRSARRSAGIPPDVEAVVLKALAKDRDQRFQTMKEMALALEACAGGDPSQAWGNGAVGRRGGAARALAGVPHAGRRPVRAAVGAAAPSRRSSPDLVPPKKRTGLVVGVALGALLVAGGGGGDGADAEEAAAVRAKPPCAGGARRVGRAEAASRRRSPSSRPSRRRSPCRSTRSPPAPRSSTAPSGSASRRAPSCCPRRTTPVELMLKKKGFKDHAAQDRARSRSRLRHRPDADARTRTRRRRRSPSRRSRRRRWRRRRRAKPEVKPETAQAGRQAARSQRPVRQLSRREPAILRAMYGAAVEVEDEVSRFHREALRRRSAQRLC